MTSERETLALSRLGNQFTESSNLRSFISAIFEAVDDTDDMISSLLNQRHLGDASGVWLDNVGKLVGVERPLEEIDDTHYFELWDTSDDPTQNEMYEVGESLGGSGFTDGYDPGNGNIYFFPYDNNDQVIRYKKSNETWTKIGPVISGLGSPMFNGFVLGPDDKIYGLPAGANKMYRIDPATDEVEEVVEPANPFSWSRGYVVDDRIYFTPNASEYFAYYDTVTEEFNQQVGDSLGAGFFKTCGAGLKYGGYLYVTPDNVDVIDRFIKLDTNTDTWSFVGSTITKWNPSYNRLFSDCIGITSSAKMYAIPATNDKFYLFNMVSEEWSAVGADLTTIYDPSANDFSKVGFVYDGDIYAAPYDADSFVKLDTSTLAWSQVGDLTYPGAKIERRGFIVEDDRVLGYATYYHEAWELELSTLTSYFTDKASGVFNNGAFAGAIAGAIFTGYTGTGQLQKYVPEYLKGLSDVNQLEGGMLRSLTGTWLDGITYVNDLDYEVLINAKAVVSFLGSTQYTVILYINEAFEVTGTIEIDTNGDWYITLDSYLASKERRYLLTYAPEPAGSIIYIAN